MVATVWPATGGEELRHGLKTEPLRAGVKLLPGAAPARERGAGAETSSLSSCICTCEPAVAEAMGPRFQWVCAGVPLTWPTVGWAGGCVQRRVNHCPGGLTVIPTSPPTALLPADPMAFNTSFSHAATFTPRQGKGKKGSHLFICYSFFFFFYPQCLFAQNFWRLSIFEMFFFQSDLIKIGWHIKKLFWGALIGWLTYTNIQRQRGHVKCLSCSYYLCRHLLRHQRLEEACSVYMNN